MKAAIIITTKWYTDRNGNTRIRAKGHKGVISIPALPLGHSLEGHKAAAEAYQEKFLKGFGAEFLTYSGDFEGVGYIFTLV